MNKKPLDVALVKEFIIAAHSDLEEVKRLLEKEPALLHSVINWGEGDWESAIGAGAHTGNREMVEWLLEQKAHMDIFVAAMLGEIDIVKSILHRQPNALYAKGPHGISLIRHAEVGGEQAKPVLEYLQSLLLREEV